MAETLVTICRGLLSACSGPGTTLSDFYLLAHLVFTTIELGLIICPTLPRSVLEALPLNHLAKAA